MMEKNVVLLGAGHRGISLLKILIKNHPNFVIRCIFDPNEEAMILARAEFPQAQMITNDIDLVTNDIDSVDLVMICSQNNLHLDHFMVATSLSRQIFCEKPIGINMKELNFFRSTILDNGINFMTGFVLRHSAFYQKIKELIPEIGQVLNMDVHDNLYYGHGAHIMKNWRRYEGLSGGHLVEKCVHVLDLINWFLGSKPSKVYTMGRKDIWVPKNIGWKSELETKYNDPDLFNKYKDWEQVNPFESGSTILHAATSNIKYENGTLVNFSMNTFCPNSSRRFHIIGSMGEIEARWEKNTAMIKQTIRGMGKKNTVDIPGQTLVYDFGPTGCHGNADGNIMDYVAESVILNKNSMTDFDQAYDSTKLGILLEESAKAEVALNA